ncbi:hypothetical protein GMSM_33800 [Geomonas sp. Red276]
MNKKPVQRNQSQAGYLMEVPILLCLVAVSLALIIPHLSTFGRKIAVSIAAFPVLFCLYYMIVIPGWRGGERASLGPVMRWVIFALAALGIVTVVVMIDLG